MLNTKLVYVLTSAPEKNYIEQALISIYTARYYNPEATIVLIVDDLTDKLFVGNRAEVLDYITEKLVIELPEDMNMMERSRWLKTSVRNLVDGDILFIDCDTLITCSLEEIDWCPYDLGAVLESHLPVAQFNSALYDKVKKNAAVLDWDISKEAFYYSSGVILAKDTTDSRLFFERWHNYWLKGSEKGVPIDQPSFAKADIESGYRIHRMDDRFNCVMYTHTLFVGEAKIMHFCSFRNMSYVFSDHFLEKVKNEGVKGNEFIQYSVLHPHNTYLPFDNSIFHFGFKDYIQMIVAVRKVAKLVNRHLNGAYDDYISTSGIDNYLKKLFNKHLYFTGACLLAVYKFYKVKLNKKYSYVSNTCSADNI